MKEAVQPFLLVPVGFIALGLLFAYLGVRGRRGAEDFRAKAARATGEVTEIRNRWSATEGSTATAARSSAAPSCGSRCPTAARSRRRRRAPIPAPATQGAQVTVLYDPVSPTNAVIDSRWADGTIGSGCITPSASSSRS
ncbi:MAG: DUF3592 domain-containing protein [Actinomycetota bacterium]|nr:DUF3592 domain-containing protein [Actinomycetota bacterium]